MKKIILSLLILSSTQCFAWKEYFPIAVSSVFIIGGTVLVSMGTSYREEVDSCRGWPSTCCVSDENNRTEIYNCKKFENPTCELQDTTQYFCINKDDATLLASSTGEGVPDWDQGSCLSKLQNCCVDALSKGTQNISIEECQSSGTLNCTTGTKRSLCIDRSRLVLIGTAKIEEPLWGKAKILTAKNWLMLGFGIVCIMAAVPAGLVTYTLNKRCSLGIEDIRESSASGRSPDRSYFTSPRSDIDLSSSTQTPDVSIMTGTTTPSISLSGDSTSTINVQLIKEPI